MALAFQELQIASPMINTLALNLIAAVMGWDNETATEEYAWLQLMSSMKYDGYSDFRAGVRFLESLVSWLRHFDAADRPAAYDFVKTRLVYISTLEMQRVIETFVPEIVTPYLRRSVGARLGIKPYEVWKTAEAAQAFSYRLRRCLFVGLSDGSRIDVLRRTNAGRLSQEQVVPMMNVDDEKWRSLAKDLRKVGVHHYVSTMQARDALRGRVLEAEAKLPTKSWGRAIVTEGMLLPDKMKIGAVDKNTRIPTATSTVDKPIVEMCGKYYDHELYKRLERHCKEAGQSDMKYGYADCALPLILEHNTPNNSIPMLWAETDGPQGMHPLFLRRDRHG